MAHGVCRLDSNLGLSFGIGGGGSFSYSGDCAASIGKICGVGLPIVLDGVDHCFRDSGTCSSSHRKMVEELDGDFGRVSCSGFEPISLPQEVKLKWEYLNGRKSRRDLGFLTWNVNGRLDFRGCRESLLRRWILRGSVDVVLIQFKNISKGAIRAL